MSKRIKFFICHLSISILIILLTTYIIFFIWYPSPLVEAVGVISILLIMVLIDVIIGPFLSWLVYKEGKKNLKIDLIFIIIIQILAFIYGLYTITQGRPIWVVYSVDHFQLIRKNDIILQPNVKVQSEFKNIPNWGPQFSAIKLSSNKKERERDMFNAVFGLTLAKQPNRYISYNNVKYDMKKNALPLDLLENFNSSKEIKKILAKYPQATAFLPMKASAIDMTVLIDSQGDVVKIVDLRPWH